MHTAKDLKPNGSLGFLGDSKPSSLRDPMKILDELEDKYSRQKTIYRESKELYSKMNLFLFYLPVLIVQGQTFRLSMNTIGVKLDSLMIAGITTVLTHVAILEHIDNHGALKVIVAVLNGFLSVWSAAQLKLGFLSSYHSNRV